MNAIQTLSFQNFPVSFRNDGYLNATEIAQSFGKAAKDYLKTERTQEYIAALIEFLSDGKKILSQSDLVIVKKGNSKNFTQGTWLHPKLAIDFARWLNPKFAVWCDEQIENLLSGSLKTQTAKLGCLTLEQQDAIKKFHRELVQSAPKEKQAALAIGLWSAIKTKFGVSYKQVPEAHYPEVLSLMARVALEKGALSGVVLDKETPPSAAALNDYELTRLAQFLTNNYLMMLELFRVKTSLLMLGAPFGRRAEDFVKNNLPLFYALVHSLKRFRLSDPLCAPEFDELMEYLCRANLKI